MSKTLAKESSPSANLFAEHCREKLSRFQHILKSTGHDALVIGSGSKKIQFQDDMAYPFVANPYFREWIPLGKRAGSFLRISLSSSKPQLYLLAEEDIWHTAPQELPEGYDSCLEIIQYTTTDDLNKHLFKSNETAVLVNETNDFDLPVLRFNTKSVLTQIDYQRRNKTAYEHACIRTANQMAVPGHQAAEEAFRAGASELEIASAYLGACHCSESDMPYGIIAGINENAAVLHHTDLNKHKVAPRSFLIDAGVACQGYAADITRTYAYDQGSDFAAMIKQMDKVQQELVALGAIGQCPLELHVQSQHKVAQVLIDFKLLKGSPDQAVEQDIVSSFYPHGLGHHLGCNVHDKGSQLANPQGDPIPASKTYPNLRASAPMEANQVHTVEPGVYFIPSLLARLQASDKARCLNWPEIEQWIPYGGIRIEDNVIVHGDNSLENITRAAFKGLNN